MFCKAIDGAATNDTAHMELRRKSVRAKMMPLTVKYWQRVLLIKNLFIVTVVRKSNVTRIRMLKEILVLSYLTFSSSLLSSFFFSSRLSFSVLNTIRCNLIKL